MQVVHPKGGKQKRLGLMQVEEPLDVLKKQLGSLEKRLEHVNKKSEQETNRQELINAQK
jgi:hypothetical protein